MSRAKRLAACLVAGLALSVASAPLLARDDTTIAADRSLGVDIAGIAIIGAEEAVSPSPVRGISISGLAHADRPALEAALAPFIGQPLTPARIEAIQSGIAETWRRAGHPFMSATLPPQEVTSGVLTLRVVQFAAGTIAMAGTDDSVDLTAHLRQQQGQEIDAPTLAEDLAWLNRHPYRQVEAVFAPGAVPGTSDIAILAQTHPPVTAFAGWDNGGNAATGHDRFSIGGGAWLPVLNDMTIGWRVTRNGASWTDGPFALDPAAPGYLALSGHVELPLAPRKALSIAPSLVSTNELAGDTGLSFANETLEIPIFYRGAISDLLPAHKWGDVYAGIEPKWLRRTTAFDGVPVAEAEIGIVNLVVGWSHRLVDPLGTTHADLRLTVDPGLGATGAEWSAFTGGRVTGAGHVHARLQLDRETPLPHGFIWTSRLSAQFANAALPDPERLGIAGNAGVRGYEGTDGAADAGLVWRNQLHLPALAPLENAGLADRLSPFAFLDLGYGLDLAQSTTLTPASAGLGLDYAVGPGVEAGLTAAMALTQQAQTDPGDWRLEGRLKLTY